MKPHLEGYTEVAKGSLGSYSVSYKECDEKVTFNLEIDQLGCEELDWNYGAHYSILKDDIKCSLEALIECSVESLLKSLKLFMAPIDKTRVDSTPCVKLD